MPRRNRKKQNNPDNQKPTKEMAAKLEAEISKRRELKTVSKFNEPHQLSGLDRKRFIARCLIRKYNEQIYELKRFISVRELNASSADYIIGRVQEFKTKMQKL
jgi:hypothetical protein